MAQERHVTPEKQLLNLIEAKKTEGQDIRAQAARHGGLSLLSLGAWAGRLFYFKDNFKKLFSGGAFQFDLGFIDRALTFVICALLCYLGVNTYLSIGGLKKIQTLKYVKYEGRGPAPAALDAAVLTETMAYYLDKVKGRDIFKMSVKEEPQQKEIAAVLPSSKAVEATQHLKLVGISWSKDPDVMIEDTKALRTLFVKAGHKIGDVKVEAVYKDRVILSYDGEAAELR